MKKILSFAGAILLAFGMLACAEERSSSENVTHSAEEETAQTVDEACRSIEGVIVEAEQALLALTSVASNTSNRYVPGLEKEERQDPNGQNDSSESDADEHIQEFFTDPQAYFEIYLKSAEPQVILNTWISLNQNLETYKKTISNKEIQTQITNLHMQTVEVEEGILNAYDSPGDYDTDTVLKVIKMSLSTYENINQLCSD